MKQGKPSFSLTESTLIKGLSTVSWQGDQWNDILYFPKNYQIGFVRQGEGSFTSALGTHLINQEDFFFINPGRIHSGKPNKEVGWIVNTICFQAHLFVDLYMKHTGQRIRLFPVFNRMVLQNTPSIIKNTLTDLFNSLFIRIRDNSKTKDSPDELLDAIDKLFSVLGDLSFVTCQSTQQHQAIQSAIDYIEFNF